MNDYAVRFGGIGRLYSAAGLERLRHAHVCVVGVGGVGSWAVEALARAGIGKLTLVDPDDVCVSNVNRQLHALDGEIGKPKVEVMARRARAINPDCTVHPIQSFFTAANAQEILQTPFDYVLDAIDAVSKKCLLIAMCRERRIPVLTIGAAGGRKNPAHVEVADLALSSHDQLLFQIRKRLRQDHNFVRAVNKLFNVECVYSKEPPVYPRKDGSTCDQREEDSERGLNCDSGFGTASFVTGTFGFVAAARIVQKIARGGSTGSSAVP